MELLHTLFPAAFAMLALSHFVALLSPGPDFFLLTGYAIRYRLRGSMGLCIGIAAGASCGARRCCFQLSNWRAQRTCCGSAAILFAAGRATWRCGTSMRAARHWQSNC